MIQGFKIQRFKEQNDHKFTHKKKRPSFLERLHEIIDIVYNFINSFVVTSPLLDARMKYVPFAK
jgi:hypothetical protein